MMRERIVAVLLLLVTGQVFALDKPEDIRACMRKNFPATSSTQTFMLKTIGREGSERALHATAYWKRAGDGKAKVMLSVDSPDDLRGSAYLMVELATRDDLFMYLPAAGRTKRILGNQTSDSLWGTDFSYEDIKQVQGIFDSGKLVREADAEVAGKKVYVLSFVPAKVEESAYRRLMSHVDQTTCVALQTDFYEAGDTPRKRLSVKPQEVKQEGQRWVAHFYEMSDLRDGTRSELRIEKMTADTDLPERLFNPKTFQLGR
ncbi:MAG: outer membrane lipoprotein-sorting protein [Nevskiales bacterium]